jgi:hypothetical protein
VLIVNIFAGLIVDLVLLPKKDKQPGWMFYLAAGLSSASNIFVFQFFASIPRDILTFLAILLTSGVAFISGIIFGGLVPKSLLVSLYKVGILSEPEKNPGKRNFIWPLAILMLAVALTISTGLYYINQQSNTQGIQIEGNVVNPFVFPFDYHQINVMEIDSSVNGANRPYARITLEDLVKYSEPLNEPWVLQVNASDGYSFFISKDEIFSNTDLILVSNEVGGHTLYNIEGAHSSKAWIRGVSQMKVISKGQIQVNGMVEKPFIFLPEDWIEEMDSTFLNLDGVSTKLQGVALRFLWTYAQPKSEFGSMEFTCDKKSLNIPSEEFMDNDEMRVFILLGDKGMEFLLGRMNGEVLLRCIHSIEIK